MGCCISKKASGEIIVASKHFKAFRADLPSMSGKVVAITGCTTGTGRICARVCAELGATVVLLNRSSERADALLEDIKAVAKASGAPTPIAIPCNLTSFKSVREAGERMCSELESGGLDVLCNNAGIMGFGDIATEDGCDIQMQTNHTSHFLLTSLCMPLLEKAASVRGEARIVNHSSSARKMDGMENRFDKKYVDKNGGNLGGDSHKMMKGANFQRYQQTKLANVIFTYALHDKLKAKGSQIKVLVAHPGVAPTALATGTIKAGGMNDLKALPKCISDPLLSSMMQSEEDATMGILRCCCDPKVQSKEFYGPRGSYETSMKHDKKEYKGKAELKAEEALADTASRIALWDVSEKVTGIGFEV
mmetsp:Transcript_76174/g.223301  ORF Transcript_76174/g.223301 Transcript_76174/m.223301 type:complete len:363 (-) Transcript_76174:149-1237(-)